MLIFAITLFPAPLWSQDKSEHVSAIQGRRVVSGSSAPAHRGRHGTALRHINPPMSAPIFRRRGASFDDAIGLRENGVRKGNAERLRRLQVDHQLQQHRLLDWEVTWAGTFKDAIDITCAAPVDCGPTRPVTDEATAVQPATPARLS
jgi:hypothetical protein